MPVVSAGDLTSLRSRNQRTTVRISWLVPPILWKARINDGSIVKGETTITFDGGNGSFFSMVEALQEVWIGSADGLNDVGRLRIKSISSGDAGVTGTLVVGGHSHQLQDDLYLTFIHDYPLKPKFSFVDYVADPEGNLWYMDDDVAYTDQHSNPPPVVIAGPHRPGWLDPTSGDTVFNVDASGSYTIASGATKSSYALSVASVHATPVVNFNTSTGLGDITFDTAGTYWAKYSVTDSNGKTQVSYRWYEISDSEEGNPSNMFIDCKTVSLEADWDSGGWTATVTAEDNMSLSEIPDHALCAIWHIPTFEGVPNNQITFLPDNNPAVFVGYVRQDTQTQQMQDGYGDVDLVLSTVEGRLRNIFAFSTSLIAKKTAPSKWWEYEEWQTCGTIVHDLFLWRSTLLETTDVIGLRDDTLNRMFQGFDEGNVYENADTFLYAEGIRKRVLCDQGGRVHITEDQQLMVDSDRGALATIMEFIQTDAIADYGNTFLINRQQEYEAPFVTTGGIYWDGNTWDDEDRPKENGAYCSIAPGGKPLWQGSDPQDFPNETVSSQDHLNKITGRYEAKINNTVVEVVIEFHGMYNTVLDIAYGEQYVMDLQASETPRGIVWSNKPLYCRHIQAVYDAEFGVWEVSATFEPENVTTDGVYTECPSFPQLGGYLPPSISNENEVPGALITGASVNFKPAAGDLWTQFLSQDVKDLIQDPHWRAKTASSAPSNAIMFRCGTGYIKRSTDAFESVDVDVTPGTAPPNDAGDAPAPTATNVTYFMLDGSHPLQDEFVVMARWQNATSDWRSWLAYSDDNGTTWTWMSIPSSVSEGEDGSNLSFGAEYKTDDCTYSHDSLPGYSSSIRSIVRLTPYKAVGTRMKVDDGGAPCGDATIEGCVIDIAGQAVTFGSWYALGPANTVIQETADVVHKAIEVDENTFITVEAGLVLGASPNEWAFYVAAANVAGTLITQGTPVLLEQQDDIPFRNTAVAKLEDNKVVVASYKYDEIKAYVCNVAGNSVTPGTAQSFSTGGGEIVQMCALDATKVICIYGEEWRPDEVLYARVGTVSGLNISWGSPYQVNVGGVGDNRIQDNTLDCIALSDTHFAVSWSESDRTTPFHAWPYVRIGSVSGSVITFGSATLIETQGDFNYGQFISLEKFNAEKLLVYYMFDLVPYDVTYKIGTVDGTGVSFGNAIVAPDTGDYYGQVKVLDASSGTCISWVYDGNFSENESRAQIINGMPYSSYLIESFGALQQIGDQEHRYLSGYDQPGSRYTATPLTDTKVVLSSVYQDGSSNTQIQVWVADISGDTITEGIKHNIGTYEWNTPKFHKIVAIDSNTFLCIWADYDPDTYNDWTALIQAGTVSGTNITFGNILNWDTQFGTGGDRYGVWEDVAICRVSNNRAIVAMDAYMSHVSIVGQTIAWMSGTEYTPSSDHNGLSNLTRLTDTKFVIGFQTDFSPYNYRARAIIGEVAGSALSFGSEYEVNSDTAQYSYSLDVCGLTDSTFAILWKETVGSERHLFTRVGSVSGTVITFGAKTTVHDPTSSSYQPYQPRVNRLDDTNYLISFYDSLPDIETFNIATVGETNAVWLLNGPWVPSGIDDSLFTSSHVLSTSKAIAWRVEDDCVSADCYATAYIINLVGGSGGGGGDVGYDVYAHGLQIAKGTGTKAWFTACNDTILQLYEVGLPALTLDNAVDLGSASIAQGIAQTYLAYPFVPYGYDDAVYVFGRMDDPQTLGSPSHVIRTIDGGSNFGLIEDDWGADHCGALALSTSNYLFAIRNTPGGSKLYVDGANNVLLLRITMPFPSQIAPHGMFLNYYSLDVYAIAWVANAYMVTKVSTPYISAANLTFDHDAADGGVSIIQL